MLYAVVFESPTVSPKPAPAVLVSLLLIGAVVAGANVVTAAGAPDAPAAVTAVSAPTTAADSTPTGDPEPATETGARAANASFGAEISGFLLSTAAETNSHIDSGMWVVAFERAPNLTAKQQVIDRRTAVLDDRLDRIEARSGELFTDADNRSLTRRARRAGLAGEFSGLRAAINEAETAATSAGVDASGIKQLGSEASNVTLPPTVAALEARRGGPEPDDARTAWDQRGAATPNR